MTTYSVNEVNRLTAFIEDIIRQAPIPQVTSDFYAYSYPIYIRSFARVESGTWTADLIIEKLSMVYAWMPKCIRDYNLEAIDGLAHALNRTLQTAALIGLVSRCVNNSLVGGTKFMHFYDPKRFAMCDSNMIALLWPGRNSMPSPSAGLARYMHLLAAMEAISPELQQRALTWAVARFCYPTTPMRAIEALLFHVARTGQGDAIQAPPYSGQK